MDESQIRERLTGVFRDVFDSPGLVITEKTTAGDIEEWNSLTHVNLIVAVEQAFGIRFTTKEVKTLENVGDLIGLIAGRAK